MNTLLLKATTNDIATAARILRDGGLVAMPTETVYGLAADALNGKAVEKIFIAKGRPMDNPLIVHIGDIEDIKRLDLVSNFPDSAQRLADAFWPGALTIILPKSDKIPLEVSAGLDTVAIRYPSHKVANELIRASGTALAAPSANLSGRPSPTTAEHCVNDLFGKVEAILDGGACEIGLESTVITLATKRPRLLRPGGITLEQLVSVLGEVDVDDAVLNKLAEGQIAHSPGMKYKHYAPRANVTVIKGGDRSFIDYVNSNSADDTAVLCYDEDIIGIKNCKIFTIGGKDNLLKQAQLLFDKLREIDKDSQITRVYSRCPSTDGVGMAVYNRLIRAAGFEVIDIEEL